MRFVVQRVKRASVKENGAVVSRIGYGLLAYMGVHRDDEPDCQWWAEKLLKLRLFPDEQKPINRSVRDVNGEILVVSQFTLYGDASGQNRPSFIKAAPPETAQPIYEAFLKALKAKWLHVQTGVFGGDMAIESVNDGPTTILL